MRHSLLRVHDSHSNPIDTATDVEGIFRLSGSEKRIKELKYAFDSPDRYGKGLDWTGYTVHDAANILRRYFNQLPEPIIPLDFYDRFRDPLRNHQAQAVGPMDLQGPVSGPFDAIEAIRAYQSLITELPPLNRQLLLYILDLLAVFASKSDLNKMTTANLAAIFQPGLLSHPQHDMAPAEYRLSQDVLIFLIENQDHFLIGMHGTAADEKTVRDVQSAAQSPRTPSTPTTPQRFKTVIGRSASNASAGADSVRKFGNLRRNVSVSSKTSKLSVGPQATPVTPTAINTVNLSNVSGALGRSNTVPSKRSAASPRFPRDKGSGPSTPSPRLQPTVDTSVPEEPGSNENTPVATAPPMDLGLIAPPAPPEIISASSSEATTPLAAPGSDTSSARLIPREHIQIVENHGHASPLASVVDASTERSPSGSGTPSRAFLDIFKPSPTSSEDGKREGRRKLQKKRIPGSALSSAQSSAHSLQHGADGTDEQRLISPVTPTFDSKAGEYISEHGHDRSAYATAQTSPRLVAPQRTTTDSTLRPTVSPSHSYTSHTSHDMTDHSDADYATDATHGSTSQAEAAQKKRRWRISQNAAVRNKERGAIEQGGQQNLGNLAGAEHSKSTVGSSGAGNRPPRRSFEPSGPVHAMTEPEGLLSDSDVDGRKKGPMSWIRGKIAERKERQDEKLRARSPNKNDYNASRASLALGSSAERGGKSLDIPRQRSQASAISEADKFGEMSENDVQKTA